MCELKNKRTSTKIKVIHTWANYESVSFFESFFSIRCPCLLHQCRRRVLQRLHFDRLFIELINDHKLTHEQFQMWHDQDYLFVMNFVRSFFESRTSTRFSCMNRKSIRHWSSITLVWEADSWWRKKLRWNSYIARFTDALDQVLLNAAEEERVEAHRIWDIIMIHEVNF